MSGYWVLQFDWPEGDVSWAILLGDFPGWTANAAHAERFPDEKTAARFANGYGPSSRKHAHAVYQKGDE